MPRKKKVEPEKKEYTEREVRLSNLRNDRIPNDYLTRLVLEYKAARLKNPKCVMSSELAEVFLIIIDKMLGSSRWRGYSPDWKEEFRGRAIEHLVKYGHNFSPEKSQNGRGKDAYNYYAQMVFRAFAQSWKKCKIYSDNNININHDIIYKEKNWTDDQELRIEETEIYTETDIDRLDYGSLN